MEIGIIYSRSDPKQVKARDFVKKFIKDHGIAARIIEREQEVSAPTLSINGQSVVSSIKDGISKKFPSLDEISRELEKNLWSL